MNTQILVVDLVRNWHTLDDNSRFATKEMEHFALSMITVPAAFEGAEEFSAVVLWDELPQPTAEGEPWLDKLGINEVIRKFAIATGNRMVHVVHDNHTTKVKMKSDKARNVENFDWLEINLEEHKQLE